MKLYAPPFREFNSQSGGKGEIIITRESIDLYFRRRKVVCFQIDVYSADLFFYHNAYSFWVKLTGAIGMKTKRMKTYNLLWEFLKENKGNRENES
jgi:hypothetical protein